MNVRGAHGQCRQCGAPRGFSYSGLCVPHENERAAMRNRTDPRYVNMRRASRAVRLAIARGDLAPASSFACVDCGAPAQMYEHRDYSRPLEVDPTCFRCNRRRGPGQHPAGH